MAKGKKKKAQPRARLTEKEKRRIREVWLACGKNMSETARQCGVSHSTVKRHTKDNPVAMKALAVVEQRQAETVFERALARRSEHEVKVFRNVNAINHITMHELNQLYREVQELKEDAQALREEYRQTKEKGTLKIAMGLRAQALAIEKAFLKAAPMGSVYKGQEFILGMGDKEGMNVQEQLQLLDEVGKIVGSIPDEATRVHTQTGIAKTLEKIAKGRAAKEVKVFGDAKEEEDEEE